MDNEDLLHQLHWLRSFEWVIIGRLSDELQKVWTAAVMACFGKLALDTTVSAAVEIRSGFRCIGLLIADTRPASRDVGQRISRFGQRASHRHWETFAAQGATGAVPVGFLQHRRTFTFHKVCCCVWCINICKAYIERHGSVIYTHALYSRGHWFECRTGDYFLWLMFFLIVINQSLK